MTERVREYRACGIGAVVVNMQSGRGAKWPHLRVVARATQQTRPWLAVLCGAACCGVVAGAVRGAGLRPVGFSGVLCWSGFAAGGVTCDSGIVAGWHCAGVVWACMGRLSTAPQKECCLL
ncbi:hypothetical protein GCM10027074_54360 [Streptomyces deserti]